MKNQSYQFTILIRKISKTFVAAFKSVIESPEKRDFRRLKDFIAS